MGVQCGSPELCLHNCCASVPGDQPCACPRSEVRVPILHPGYTCCGGSSYSRGVICTMAIKSCGGLTQGMVLYQMRDRDGGGWRCFLSASASKAASLLLGRETAILGILPGKRNVRTDSVCRNKLCWQNSCRSHQNVNELH